MTLRELVNNVSHAYDPETTLTSYLGPDGRPKVFLYEDTLAVHLVQELSDAVAEGGPLDHLFVNAIGFIDESLVQLRRVKRKLRAMHKEATGPSN